MAQKSLLRLFWDLLHAFSPLKTAETQNVNAKPGSTLPITGTRKPRKQTLSVFSTMINQSISTSILNQ
ncbi:MAG: hypothetical protein K6L75_13380 [Cellvibrionaceae bacterium]